MIARNRYVLAILCAFAVNCVTSSSVSLAADTELADSLNRLTEEEVADGWKLLFDGKSTKGWRNYRKDSVGDGWKVVDGALTRTASGAGDIITVDQYDAFEMLIQYKISPEGNSGIMFHVTEQADTPWQTGAEIQIIDNVDGHDPQKAGWLYQLYRTDKDATKPAGEWNQVRLLITPKKCVHYINGVKYFEYVKGSDDWDQRVAKSKFSQYEHFGKATRGYICLQDHGDEIAYRDIKIRPISSTK